MPVSSFQAGNAEWLIQSKLTGLLNDFHILSIGHFLFFNKALESFRYERFR